MSAGMPTIGGSGAGWALAEGRGRLDARLRKIEDAMRDEERLKVANLHGIEFQDLRT
jgi:hypothetical protein